MLHSWPTAARVVKMSKRAEWAYLVKCADWPNAHYNTNTRLRTPQHWLPAISFDHRKLQFCAAANYPPPLHVAKAVFRPPSWARFDHSRRIHFVFTPYTSQLQWLYNITLVKPTEFYLFYNASREGARYRPTLYIQHGMLDPGICQCIQTAHVFCGVG